MSSYDTVRKALADGRDPAALCTTCPWDRHCISPPDMTRGDVAEKIREGERMDREIMRAAGGAAGLGLPPDQQSAARIPVATLMSQVIYGDRDTTAQICPVFALRMQSSAGRELADGIRATMQGWDDQK